MPELTTKQQIEDEVYTAMCRIANDVAGADAMDSDDFDESVAMAVHDATTCLAELLPISEASDHA